MRATFPSRSPTVVFSWPSATRTTDRKPTRPDARNLARSATRSRRCPRCTPPRRGRRPSAGDGPPRRSGAGDRRAPGPAARSRSRPRRPRGASRSLPTDSSIAGCSSWSRFTVPARRGARSMISSYRPPGFSVTIMCWSNASRTPDHVLRDLAAPVGDASGGRRADRHLQLHDRIVEGLTALPRLAECRRQRLLGVHQRTLRGDCAEAQTAIRAGRASRVMRYGSWPCRVERDGGEPSCRWRARAPWWRARRARRCDACRRAGDRDTVGRRRR